MHKLGSVTHLSLIHANSAFDGQVNAYAIVHRDREEYDFRRGIYGPITPSSAGRVRRAIDKIAEVRSDH